MNATNSSVPIDRDCFQEAWDFGTEEGGGDETIEWEMMNRYYTMWCMN